jgi:ubiquinone/menaquinone biosynthesis C-methylase UbiE
MDPFDFPWPTPPGHSEPPVWSEHGFKIGDTIVAILSYDVGSSGWTDGLTRFHEATAGATHSIDHASRQYALGQLHRYVTGKAPVILEVGCSSGFLLRLVRERLPHAFVVGSDCVRGPLEQLAHNMPNVPLLEFDLVSCPLPENSVDAVVLLNVLEHIQDDAAAVRQVYRILKPGGVAVIEVPAGPQLYDLYDRLLLHHRRYSRHQLRSLVERAGFRVVRQSHLGCLVYPAFWCIKQRNKRFLYEAEAVQRQIVARNIRATKNSRLFDAIMRIERLLGRWLSYPFGIRCLVTCRKAP